MYLITRPTTTGPLELYRFEASSDVIARKEFRTFFRAYPDRAGYKDVASLIRVKPDGRIALIA